MGEELNPYVLLKSAAAGEVDALRILADTACKQGIEGGDLIAFVEALVFARLAYAATRDLKDAGVTFSILAAASQHCPDELEMRFSWNAEAVALASRLADEGDPFADEHLSAIVAKSGAEATVAAKEIVKLMEGAD